MRPDYRGRIVDFSLIFDRKVFLEAKIWVENFHIYAPGAGIGIPSLEPPISRDGLPEGCAVGGHAHDFDQLFLFLSADPHDTLNLGGEVEFWLGEGKAAEKFNITKSTGEYVPAGVVHNPHYFRKVDRPFVMAVISLTSNYAPKHFWYKPLPDSFKF
ncbi:MAG: hypothetical protein P8Z37_10545 [Acidobacteriota bacterium]